MGGASVLEFGVGTWSMQSTYVHPHRHGCIYEAAAREAKFAEQAGFDSIWMAEHHASYDGYCPSPIAAAAFLLSSTTRIKVCAGVILLPLHSAHRVAEGCAAVDSISPKRLRLALAQGYRARDFETEGKSLSDRKSLWTAAVESLLGELAPRAGTTELWAGARADVAVKRAAHYGLPLQMSGAGSIDQLRHTLALYRSEFRRRPGGPPSKALLMKDVWVERDQKKIDWVKRCLTESWLPFSDAFLKNTAGHWLPGVDRASANARHDGASFLASEAIVGSPAEVIDGLGPYMSMGADGIVFRVKFDGMISESICPCLELLSADVLPALRRAA